MNEELIMKLQEAMAAIQAAIDAAGGEAEQMEEPAAPEARRRGEMADMLGIGG